MLRLYDFLDSGNGYKVRLVLRTLGIPFELIECDILKGETRKPDFLRRNPNGRIPTLELEDGSFLAESNAIAWYLAEGTDLAPASRLDRARTLQWMFFEQYSHEPYVAVLRAWKHVGFGLTPDREQQVPEKLAKGNAALAVMEQHLARQPWFVGGRFGLADIALFAYTHVAHEGGFDMKPYPAIRGWIDRIAALPRHVPITWKPAKAA